MAISGGWCFTHSRHVSKTDPPAATKSFRVAHNPPQNPGRTAPAVSHSKWTKNQRAIFP